MSAIVMVWFFPWALRVSLCILVLILDFIVIYFFSGVCSNLSFFLLVLFLETFLFLTRFVCLCSSAIVANSSLGWSSSKFYLAVSKASLGLSYFCTSYYIPFSYFCSVYFFLKWVLFSYLLWSTSSSILSLKGCWICLPLLDNTDPILLREIILYPPFRDSAKVKGGKFIWPPKLWKKSLFKPSYWFILGC